VTVTGLLITLSRSITLTGGTGQRCEIVNCEATPIDKRNRPIG